LKYTKPPLALDELSAHLATLGLEGDRSTVVQRLRDVGYYRLSPYWRYYRETPNAPESRLRAGTTIDEVWRLYTFDRELRLLFLDASERIEIAVRSRLVQAHVQRHGPFGFAEGACVPRPDMDRRGHYLRLLSEITQALKRAIDVPEAPQISEALQHFATKYGDCHTVPPLWLAAESFSFGDLVTLYRGSPTDVRKEVAKGFDIHAPVMESWLLTLQTARNVCAHHGRLWNRTSRVAPRVPDHDPMWKDPVLGPKGRTFYTATILAHLLGVVSDGSHWATRFRALLDERYETVPRRPIGMMDGWERHPIWARRLGPSR
jgi:abortive infection bacteriophage resistance protein